MAETLGERRDKAQALKALDSIATSLEILALKVAIDEVESGTPTRDEEIKAAHKAFTRHIVKKARAENRREDATRPKETP